MLWSGRTRHYCASFPWVPLSRCVDLHCSFLPYAWLCDLRVPAAWPLQCFIEDDGSELFEQKVEGKPKLSQEQLDDLKMLFKVCVLSPPHSHPALFVVLVPFLCLLLTLVRFADVRHGFLGRHFLG